MKFTKRTVLGMALALAASGVARRAHALAGAAPENQDLVAARQLLRVFRHPRKAAVIGRRYLAKYPREASLERLLMATEERLRHAGGIGRVAIGRVAWQGLARAVAAAVSLDFEEERMVQIDGWMLAETEVRLCALAVLVPRGGGGGAIV